MASGILPGLDGASEALAQEMAPFGVRKSRSSGGAQFRTDLASGEAHSRVGDPATAAAAREHGTGGGCDPPAFWSLEAAMRWMPYAPSLPANAGRSGEMGADLPRHQLSIRSSRRFPAGHGVYPQPADVLVAIALRNSQRLPRRSRDSSRDQMTNGDCPGIIQRRLWTLVSVYARYQSRHDSLTKSHIFYIVRHIILGP